MDVRSYIDENAAAFFAALQDWLRIPSISADPARRGDVRRSAQWLADQLRVTGFPVAEVWETGEPGPDGTGSGLPAVFAQWPAADPAAPVVLIYGHHDVQPVEPLELWDSPPFEPTVRDGQLLARGASDDKGQVLFHLLGTAAGLAASGRDAPPVTLKLLVEGEEESGSPHFPALLRREAERLACDVVVVSDTSMWSADVPSMCVGMRGLAAAEIELRGADQDLHSGSFGGAVPNALHAMADLLAGLSFRLVADQEPARVIDGLRQYVRDRVPPGLSATVTSEGDGVRPSFSPLDSAAVRAGQRAMQRAFGMDVVFTREGGSGPEADLTDILHAPLVFVAVGLDSDRLHAPNEKVEMELLLKGAAAAAYLWDELAAAAGPLTASR